MREHGEIIKEQQGTAQIAHSAHPTLLQIDESDHNIPDETGRDSQTGVLLQHPVDLSARELPEKKRSDHNRKRGKVKTEARGEP